jgi:sec-independent protein translocase protein TatA
MLNTIFLFFEFTAPEIMLILFVTLLLFGGDKLPGLARGLGKGIRDFKDASEGVKREITNQIDNFEKKKEDEKAAEVAEETPLIAEHSTDNLDGKATENHVLNTMPVNEQSHVAGTDHVELENPENHTATVHHSETPIEPVKTTHE